MARRSFILVAVLTLSACSGSSTAPSPVSSAPTPPPNVTVTPTPPAPPLPTRDPARFDQTFWNEFVHNGFEAPPGTEPLQRLAAAPMVALMTVDDAGHAIDAATLGSTESTLRDVAPQWTGGLFGLAGIQRMTTSMRGQRGWLTLAWSASAASGFCGFSDIGVDGGVMTLYPNTPGCGCPGSVTTSKIRPRTVAHELGHAFGFFHTDNSADLMHIPSSNCLQDPSEREHYHAGLAYQTPVGSTTALPHSPITIID